MGIVQDQAPVVAGQDEDVAAIRFGEQAPVEDQVGRALGHEPAVEERRLVEPLRGADQVMGRGDHGLARSRLGLQDVHEVFLGPGVDAGHGLVQKIELGVAGEGTGQKDTPSLATGQGTDLPLHGIAHPDGIQGRPYTLAIGRARLAAEPEPCVAPHHDDLADGHRELPVHGLRLREIGDRPTRGTGWAAEHRDPAGKWAKEPGDQLEEGALACTVRPDDGEQGSLIDLERDLRQGDAAVVAGRHAIEAHGRPIRAHDRPVRQPDRRPGGRRFVHFRALTISSTFQRMTPRYVSAGAGPRASL